MHLTSQPQSLTASNAQLRQVVQLSLRKSPESRPSVESIAMQLDNVQTTKSNNSKIAEAGAKVAEKLASEEAEKVKTQTKEVQRKQLVNDAFESFRFIMNELFQHIKDQAHVSKMFSDRIILGSGNLVVIEKSNLIPEGVFRSSKWDVVCGAIIEVNQESQHESGRSSNLWFVNRGHQYRWIEVAYWTLGRKTK